MIRSAKKFVLIILLLSMTLTAACSAEIPYASTQTSLPAGSAVSTLPSTPTPRLINTPSLIETHVQKIEGLSDTCQKAYDPNLRPPSPDGKWTIYDCPETSELFIINDGASKVWHIGHSQLSGSDSVPDNFGVTHWSHDSRYVYLVPEYTSPCCWDSGIASMDSTFNSLWQFDVSTGTYFNIFLNIAPLGSDNYPSMSGISFSPKDKILLVIPQRKTIPPLIYVYDLEQNIVLDSFRLAGSTKSIVSGNVIWSPDEQIFALTSASGGDFEYYQEGEEYRDAQFSVIAVSIKDLSQEVIISETKQYVYLREITDNNILKIESSEPATINGQGAIRYEQYDLKTNQFVTSSLTPLP